MLNKLLVENTLDLFMVFYMLLVFAYEINKMCSLEILHISSEHPIMNQVI